MKIIKAGIIGVGGRGYGLIPSILHSPDVRLVAVCDKYPDRVDKAIERIKEISGNTAKPYSDYNELINDPEVEAIIISASWDAHVDIALASLESGKYTAVEVGGAYDIEDCWELVRTYERTKTPIMLLENCCYGKFELTATALARAGKLGRIVYCHGAYAHDLCDEILGGDLDRHYRLKNYTLRNCENYPTHELGPIAKVLDITRGNKILTISSVSTKPGIGLSSFANSDACRDANQRGKEFNQGDIIFTTLTCSNGEVITLKLDTTLPRYYSREFTLRGTLGMTNQDIESIFLANEHDLEGFHSEEILKDNYQNIDNYKDYMVDEWKNITPEELEMGHGGMDVITFDEFFKVVRSGSKETPIDVYDMATWMAVTPLSEQSIALGGTPLPFPDFTRGKWMYRPSKDVMELPNPEKK